MPNDPLPFPQQNKSNGGPDVNGDDVHRSPRDRAGEGFEPPASASAARQMPRAIWLCPSCFEEFWIEQSGRCPVFGCNETLVRYVQIPETEGTA